MVKVMSKLFSYVKACVDAGEGDFPKYCTTNNMIISKPDYYLNGKVPVIEDYAFALQVDGAPNVIINGKEHSFNSKRMLILNPYDEIEIKNNNFQHECKDSYTFIMISRELIEDMSYNLMGKSKVRFALDYNYITQQLNMLLLMIEKEAAQNGCGKSLMLDCFETQFVIQLLRDFKLDSKSDKKLDSHVNKNAIRLSVEFIEEYYNTNISLDELANVANMSKFHFIRIFKQVVGKTPYEYIIFKRIKEAESLLNTNALNISEIAKLCGFVNSSHFCTVFKNVVGVSPKRYLKQNV